MFELGTLIDRYGTVCVEIISEGIQKRNTKVSVQGVVALGGHFATLCWEFDFYEVKKILLFFKKKRENFFTSDHFYSENLQKEQKSTNLLL